MKLALFDLDKTLLDGDSDELWCEFLIENGELDADRFGARNAEVTRGYKSGDISAQSFCEFYATTLVGRRRDQWLPLRQQYFESRVRPRLSTASRELVARHRERGDLVVLTTATNRFLTELTVLDLGIEHLIATELECVGERFTGRIQGQVNMREGKVARLTDWLGARRQTLAQFDSTFYSDSINDLALLTAVDVPVVVNPDSKLQAIAEQRGWRRLDLRSS